MSKETVEKLINEIISAFAVKGWGLYDSDPKDDRFILLEKCININGDYISASTSSIRILKGSKILYILTDIADFNIFNIGEKRMAIPICFADSENTITTVDEAVKKINTMLRSSLNIARDHYDIMIDCATRAKNEATPVLNNIEKVLFQDEPKA